MSQRNNGRPPLGGNFITMDSKVPNLSTGVELVDSDLIVAVGVNGTVDGPDVIDAADRIVMPVLDDAHQHMWLGAMRRMKPDADDLFAYIDVVAEAQGAHCRPLDVYLRTKLTAIASLDTGIITIIDACYSLRSLGHTGSATGAFVAFLDIAYGLSGPATGVVAEQFGYAAVYLFHAV
jgi:5-methylthioadenosine/S-adenosylhomocysteine deaminase